MPRGQANVLARSWVRQRILRAGAPMRFSCGRLVSSVCFIACGPGSHRDTMCVGDACNSGTCKSGETRDCYTGQKDTLGVGPCAGGTQMCQPTGVWGNCE